MTERVLSKQEISQRILDAVGFVDELSREVGTLLDELYDSLRVDGEEPLLLERQLLPAPKRKHGSNASSYYDNHKALVLLYGSDAEDAGEAGEDDDDVEQVKPGAGIDITTDSSLLGIIVRLLEPNKAKATGFVPCVMAAYLTNLTRQLKGKKASAGSQKDFKLKRRQLLSLFWEIEPDTKPEQQVSCRVLKGHLVGTVAGFACQHLVEFDSEKAVADFAAVIQEMLH